MEALLLEDEPDLSQLLRELLQSELGIALTCVPDGAAALRRLGDPITRPRIVLLDLITPGVSGREVLERMREDPALVQIPVVVITASTGTPDVAPPVVAFLRKPFDLDQLLATVQSVLAGRRATPSEAERQAAPREGGL